TVVGGTTPADRNVISGNLVGVQVSGATSTSNLIEGNYVGTDVSGNRSVANRFGVLINGAPGNIIGGSSPAARNVVSGNNLFDPNQSSSVGVYVTGRNATGNVVLGNYIGTNTSGTGPLANGSNANGVYIENAPSNQVLNNVISGNGSTGIY